METSSRSYITRYRTKEELDSMRLEIDQLTKTPYHKITNEVLSSDEIVILLSYYQKKVIEYFMKNAKCSFPLSVYSTACYFIRNFYLKASIYKYDPNFVCYLCFYISAKVEHHYMSISSYLKLLPDYYKSFREEFVLKEIEVLKTINFNLNHSSIFSAIDGLLFQYEFYMENKATNIQKTSSLYFSAKKSAESNITIVNESKNPYIQQLLHKARARAFSLITTDLILIYPSSQLAAAILAVDIGMETLTNMLKCFVDGHNNNGFISTHTESYCTKIQLIMSSIEDFEKNYNSEWQKIVKKYNSMLLNVQTKDNVCKHTIDT